MRRWARVGIQSPIPLIYLAVDAGICAEGWDSVTYPLDILDPRAQTGGEELGFSHLSP